VSLWEHIKPTPRQATPVSIEQRGGKFSITWDDGLRTESSYHETRAQCPCAACVEEWTGKRVVDPSQIPEDIAPVEVSPVGNYALSIVWSDGHSTGIYSWQTLRAIGHAVDA
jgi:DUF971 family protein